MSTKEKAAEEEKKAEKINNYCLNHPEEIIFEKNLCYGCYMASIGHIVCVCVLEELEPGIFSPLMSRPVYSSSTLNKTLSTLEECLYNFVSTDAQPQCPFVLSEIKYKGGGALSDPNQIIKPGFYVACFKKGVRT